jgi:hypothetical protein
VNRVANLRVPACDLPESRCVSDQYDVDHHRRCCFFGVSRQRLRFSSDLQENHPGDLGPLGCHSSWVDYPEPVDDPFLGRNDAAEMI